MILTSLLLIVLKGEAYTQSKEETEKWIAEKINTHMKAISYPSAYDRSARYEYIPVRFMLQNDTIAMNFKETYTVRNEVIKWSGSFIASTHNIQNIDFHEYHSGREKFLYAWLECNCGVIIEETGRRSIPTGLIAGSDLSKPILIPLFIYGDEEPNLTKRLQTAFERLKTFYPKRKETF